jgi:tRNA(Ile)-lysidine synthase
MDSSGADVVARVRRQVAEVLERNDEHRCDHPIVVGVSGGADSLCLLDAVVATVPDARRRVFAAHVDHQLRPSSSADAEHVRQTALSLGISVTVETVNVPTLATAERLGLEEAARIGRYRSLTQFAQSTDAHMLVTGHTRDDLVETIVLHLVRGTGRRGLGGIDEVEHLAGWALLRAHIDTVTDLRLIRPLLEIGRAETVGYCEARGLRYLTDESNADPRFTRNRIRGHLLPVLRTYNPSIDRALVRMAKSLADEDRWLDDVAIERWAELRVDPGVDDVLSLADWRQVPLPLQRRIVRLMAESLGRSDLGFDAVERALEVGREDGPPQAQLGDRLVVKRQRTQLVFFKQAEGTS